MQVVLSNNVIFYRFEYSRKYIAYSSVLIDNNDAFVLFSNESNTKNHNLHILSISIIGA